MWTFIQRTGAILENGTPKGAGYSGDGAGQNNPAMQADRDIGPIPCGFYTMIALLAEDPVCGEYVIVLAPDIENQMFGREGFRWHGDSISHPGQASKGCIVSARPLRQEAWEGGDHNLQVLADTPHAAPAAPESEAA